MNLYYRIEWPEYQELMELPGWADHIEASGETSAIFIQKEWLDQHESK